MASIAHDLAHALMACDAQGQPIFDDRDRTFAIAMLAAMEGTPWHALGQSQQYVKRVYEWAGVTQDDTADAARNKIEAYLERAPLHPSLMTQLSRVLRNVVIELADLSATRTIQSPWAHRARSADELAASRGSVLGFMIKRRKQDP